MPNPGSPILIVHFLWMLPASAAVWMQLAKVVW